jgi:hypothetical protein
MGADAFDTIVEKWFDDSWSTTFSEQRELRTTLLEALSDSAPEQYINPILASSLRHFGQRLAMKEAAEQCFWVRSEWEKVDISYGLAEPFDVGAEGWDTPWWDGVTGDLGTIEVKVCYDGHHRGRATILADQLRVRCRRETKRKRNNVAAQSFHGLIWLFQHRGVDRLVTAADAVQEEASGAGLKIVRPFQVPEAADNLGNIWPSLNGEPYSCGVSLALVQLVST